MKQPVFACTNGRLKLYFHHRPPVKVVCSHYMGENFFFTAFQKAFNRRAGCWMQKKKNSFSHFLLRHHKQQHHHSPPPLPPPKNDIEKFSLCLVGGLHLFTTGERVDLPTPPTPLSMPNSRPILATSATPLRQKLSRYIVSIMSDPLPQLGGKERTDTWTPPRRYLVSIGRDVIKCEAVEGKGEKSSPVSTRCCRRRSFPI